MEQESNTRSTSGKGKRNKKDGKSNKDRGRSKSESNYSETENAKIGGGGRSPGRVGVGGVHIGTVGGGSSHGGVGKRDRRYSSSSSTSSSGASSVSSQISCSYCNVQFASKDLLQNHCLSQEHQRTIMSDEGREWKHRPPPRGLSADEYMLCQTYKDTHTCRLWSECMFAHSESELSEWRERFEYRSMKLERAREKHLHGATYAHQLLDKLSQTQQQKQLQAIITEKSEGLITSMSNDSNLRVSEKPSETEWEITLKLTRPLKVVALLHDAFRTHFTIKTVSLIDRSQQLLGSYTPSNDQEWANPMKEYLEKSVCEAKVTIRFHSAIYGTFRQAVVFDYGSEPVLMKCLCVDVVPLDVLSTLEETKSTIVTRTDRWCTENAEIVEFVPKSNDLSEQDLRLLSVYSPPTNENFNLTQTSMEKFPTRSNYKSRFHDLLNIEELAQFDIMSQFNIKTSLQLTNSYLLMPSTMSTAKYARPGELFARLELSSELSEDSHHGRLILTNCNHLLIAQILDDDTDKQTSTKSASSSKGPNTDEKKKIKRKAYEVLIEDKTKKEIYLRLSESIVTALQFCDDEEVVVEVQFQLNRLPLCELHQAVDLLPTLDIVFPNLTAQTPIPWSPQKQWGDSVASKLNPKQKEALLAITAPVATILPPILIIGPYGTGKTFTLAQALKQILEQPDSRVLICTHSNSAADLYIKDYLHPYMQEGHDVKTVRIYYRNRWVTTVHQDVQKYCLLEMDDSMHKFRMPTSEEIVDCRVVVTTLNTSRYLASLSLQKGVFSHILIDEAAQATECEVLIPLALAKPDTRIVLAGDYMQLSPEVFSPFCEGRGLSTSLLERLYDLYPSDSSCKIMLIENYRSHSAIIKYTSDLFYEGRLVSSAKQLAHPKFYPLTFYTARGEDVQDANSTAFHNNSEVYELCERLAEIIKSWPIKEWGPMGEGSIGVVTPYADQMLRIRAELRKRKLFKVNVERVLNVQGKQFRVIVLSTVRTRHTCKGGDDSLDFGFLSNAKLLTTAITRAQSLVAVVGDPVALCSVGKCRKLWEKFLSVCNEANSLYGISWSALRSQLDGVDFKKNYVLNPLAPEFIPRYLLYSRIPPLMHMVPPHLFMYPQPHPAAHYSPYQYPPYMQPHHPHAMPFLPQHFPPPHHMPGMNFPPMPDKKIKHPYYKHFNPPLPAAQNKITAGGVGGQRSSGGGGSSSALGPNLVSSQALVGPVSGAGGGGGGGPLPPPPPHYPPPVPPFMDPYSWDYLMAYYNYPYHHYSNAAAALHPRFPQHFRHPAELQLQGAAAGGVHPHAKVLVPGGPLHSPQVLPHTSTSAASTNDTLSSAQDAATGESNSGEKAYQFLNNVHFPERSVQHQVICATDCTNKLTRNPAEADSPGSSHSTTSSQSSMSECHQISGKQLNGSVVVEDVLENRSLPTPELVRRIDQLINDRYQMEDDDDEEDSLVPQKQLKHQGVKIVELHESNDIDDRDTIRRKVRHMRRKISDSSVVLEEDKKYQEAKIVELNETSDRTIDDKNAIRRRVRHMCRKISDSSVVLEEDPWSHLNKLAPGKVVTVSELEAAMHSVASSNNNIGAIGNMAVSQSSHTNNSLSSLSRAPGGPSGTKSVMQEDSWLMHTLPSEKTQTSQANNSVPGPPPGFGGGLRSVVEPLVQLEGKKREGFPNGDQQQQQRRSSLSSYRSPSVPLYLRRSTLTGTPPPIHSNMLHCSSTSPSNTASPWTASSSSPSQLEVTSSTAPNITGVGSNTVVGHGDFGLRNLSLSLGMSVGGSATPRGVNISATGAATGDNKTYAGVLRSSLQSSSEDTSSLFTSRNHLYQFFID
ncbi:unnamed protein product, partial [Meganyctiphanes norvegica]